MAQLSKGTTYTQGGSVTAANLNAHVDAATLLPGAILEQTSAPSVASTNQVLTTDGVGLYKTTLASIISPFNLFDKSVDQTLTKNLSFTSGADISLASGSIMSLSSGSQIALSSGSQIALSSGAILSLGQDPVTALQAASKQYVENYVSNKTANEIASIRLSTTANPGTTNSVSPVYYINSTQLQLVGSNTVTITVANPALFNTSSPFFLAGQYIGLATAVGTLKAKLYKIQSVNYGNGTFTITTTDTTAKNGSADLAFVYSNLTPPALPSRLDANGNKNIKSVALCLTSNKHYINYWYDSESDDMATAPTVPSGNPLLLTTQLIGNAITGTSASTQFLNALQMRDINPTINTVANIEAPAQPVGFGVSSKGINVGFFAATTTGCPQPYLHDANVSIIR